MYSSVIDFGSQKCAKTSIIISTLGNNHSQNFISADSTFLLSNRLNVKFSQL
jgi:hypothetical protein